MLENLTILLSKAEQKGQHRVQAKWGGIEYLDCFDPWNEWRRRTFAENALSAFGWTDASAEHVGAVMRAVLDELERIERPEKRMDSEPMDQMRDDGRTRWLWPGRIALDSLCVIAGDPGLGKSVLSLDIAAHASRGAPWPDESGFAPVTSVLLMSAEDDFVNTIRPRLVAAGADLSRVTALKGIVEGSGKTLARMLDISQDLEALQDSIEAVPPPRLLVIDPISAYLGAVSENANAEVRSLLRPLAEMAASTETAIVLISHLRKAKGSSLHRIIGSIAFAAVARSALVVQKVKDVGGRDRRLVPVKCNLEVTRKALRFRVEKHPDYPQPQIVWGAEESHDDVSLPQEPQGRPNALTPDEIDALDRCVALGPVTLDDLRERLRDRAPSDMTLKRLVDARYRWLEEKRGRLRLIGVRDREEANDERS
ncbi:MAG: AAA family ATPase [Pirellulales bacterium]